MYIVFDDEISLSITRFANMEIKNIEPRHYEEAIFPGISFDVEISYTKYEEAIISINGWLRTDDGTTMFPQTNHLNRILHRK